ncbi:MAG: type 4a pilus biogenesis protein PilO [Sideroxyarcus sp.]|nr:type 4a pilus biogenesis protein PilO [Sideroxyarcus sp.]
MRHRAQAWLQTLSARLAQRLGAAPELPLRWTARRWLQMLGIRGAAGIGLLFAVSVFHFSAVAHAQARLDEVQRSALELRELTGQSQQGAPRSPDEELEQYYRIFPEERTSPQWLAKLAKLAEKNGLRLDEGEYKATQDKTGRLMRLQITLPVNGEYRQIRRFLAALPAEIPIVALENVQFSRRKVADSNVEARIRLALFMGQSS